MVDTSELSCPYCGGHSLNIIYEDLEGARVECLECGSVFNDDEAEGFDEDSLLCPNCRNPVSTLNEDDSFDIESAQFICYRCDEVFSYADLIKVNPNSDDSEDYDLDSDESDSDEFDNDDMEDLEFN